MALTLEELSVSVVPRDGGYVVSILSALGSFNPLYDYQVRVGTGGSPSDWELALSGISGRPHVLKPVNDQRIDFYTPVLETGTMSVYVLETDTAEDGTMVDVLEVVEPVYRQTIFDVRRVLPINYRLGPRNMELLHRVGESEAFPHDGLLRSVTSVIGDSDNEIGGLYQTRLTSPVSTGATVLPVESTYGFPDSGKVALQGIVYRYGSKTLTTLEDIVFLLNGAEVVGTAKDHREEAVVVDQTQIQSAINLVRRSMLVDYAESEYLNALGRNLGVNRLPFLKSDDVFREIVKYLAYNPRGTFYGIELALTGLIGEGNFNVYEDVIQSPNTVFVELTGSVTTEDFPYGKTYIEGSEFQPATGVDTLDIDAEPTNLGTIGSVRFKDENHTTDCSAAYPSADTIVEYDGGPSTPVWATNGAGVIEGTHIVLTGGGTRMLSPPVDFCMYGRNFRLLPESDGEAAILVTVPTGAPNDAAQLSGLYMGEQERMMVAGVFALNATQWQVGFVAAGAWISGPAITLQRDSFHEVRIKKSARNDVELYVDGTLVQTAPYSSFNSYSSDPFVSFGHVSPTAGNQMTVKQAAFYAHTCRSFWNARGSSGAVATANPARLDTNSGLMLAGDVGKQMIVRGSGVTNPQGGNNNGDWLVDSYVDTDNVELVGRQQANATLQSAFPTRIAVPSTAPPFRFPDDLGKQIEISGSGAGNDGTYVIGTLLDPDTLTDLAAGATPVPAITNICEVTAAAFNTETGVDWKLKPAFVTESNLEWELAEAGSRSGTTLTMRQNFPVTFTAIYDIRYSQVLTAQLLLDTGIANAVIQEVPDLLYAYYPFYLSDPLGFVKQYLDDITAAGVIPDYEIV